MILILGGAGYIGAHVVQSLLTEGEEVLVLDDLSTGHLALVPPGATFIRGDLGDEELIQKLLQRHPIEAVMHFAALSIVGESVLHPMRYYYNNVVKTFALLNSLHLHGIRQFVFSSSAAVYGEPEETPIREDARLQPTNPYGRTKCMVEQILEDMSSEVGMRYVSLRYFNAAGASVEANIGEWHEPETHLIPIVLAAAADPTQKVVVFGDDYETPDGTCVRDYVHVEDIADAHVRALRHLRSHGETKVYNLGSGGGFSVKQVIEAAERVTGQRIQVHVGPRRDGDPSVLVASYEKIERDLGWTPARSRLDAIVDSAWRWHQLQETSK